MTKSCYQCHNFPEECDGTGGCKPMNNELEPCPFCPDGGNPIRMQYGEEPDVEWFSCKCSKCGASVDKYDTPDEADNAWNTRYKRTCRMRHFDTKESRKGTRAKMTYFQCSVCGGTTISDMEMTPKAGGWLAYKVKPSFCLHCGSEVVDDD